MFNNEMVRTLRAGSNFQIVHVANFCAFIDVCRREQHRTFFRFEVGFDKVRFFDVLVASNGDIKMLKSELGRDYENIRQLALLLNEQLNRILIYPIFDISVGESRKNKQPEEFLEKILARPDVGEDAKSFSSFRSFFLGQLYDIDKTLSEINYRIKEISDEILYFNFNVFHVLCENIRHEFKKHMTASSFSKTDSFRLLAMIKEYSCQLAAIQGFLLTKLAFIGIHSVNPS